MILSLIIFGLITFTNPVIGINCPDPTLLDDREHSGWLYIYSTQSTACGCAVNKDSSPVDENVEVINLPIYRSRDLVEWEFVGDGFPDGKPSWVKNSRLWAPDISYIGGKYVLHYALGVWGGIFKEGCGVAVSDSPEGPFKGPDGQSMKRMKYRYTALKADGVTFAGPGHHSGIVTDEAGQDWLLYHCYDARNGWNGRLLFLGRVDWDEDGWPVISRGGPVAESEAPCFGGNATLTGINKEVE